MKNWATLAALIGIIVLVAWLGGCLPYPASQPAPNNTATTTVETVPLEPVTIKISNFSFYPAETTVKSGTEVIFVNFDTAAHQVRFIGGTPGDSSVMAYGERFTYTLSRSGTYDYVCAIHPSMKGKIIVE